MAFPRFEPAGRQDHEVTGGGAQRAPKLRPRARVGRLRNRHGTRHDDDGRVGVKDVGAPRSPATVADHEVGGRIARPALDQRFAGRAIVLPPHDGHLTTPADRGKQGKGPRRMADEDIGGGAFNRLAQREPGFPDRRRRAQPDVAEQPRGRARRA